MYKVNYHYSLADGISKTMVCEVFMTFEEAAEYILGKYDDLIERDHNIDGLDEGFDAEVCKDVIAKNYKIEYVKDL